MTKKTLPPHGLVTNPSRVRTIKGALLKAENVLALRPDTVEPRNGLENYATLGVEHRKLFSYAGSLLVSGNGGSFYKDNGGLWEAYLATLSDNGDSERLQSLELGANLYLYALEGVHRLFGIGDEPARAGGARGLCLDLDGPTAVLVGSGWLADDKQVAYQYVIGVKDAATGKPILGAPSRRTIVSNSANVSGYAAATSRNVVARCLLDDRATTSHWIELYRSRTVDVGTQPDADAQLVFRDYLTTKNVADGYVEITDIFPDGVPKGEFIYTSPNAGKAEGSIDGENLPPPAAVCGVEFKNRHFLFNLSGYATFPFTILAVGGSSGIQVGDGLIIDGTTFTAVGSAPGADEFIVHSGGSSQQNVEQTALSLVGAINKSLSGHAVYAHYVSLVDGAAGQILLEAKVPSQSFTVRVTHGSQRLCYEPVLIPVSENFTLQRSGTTVTATAGSAHTLRVGEQAYVGSSNPSFTAGAYTILSVTSTTFTYSQGSGAAGPSAGMPVELVTVPTFSYESRADRAQNGFAYSKLNEFEAFPRRNRGFVGGATVSVSAAIALKQSVIVWSSAGIFRLTGDDPQTFRVDPIDPEARLLAQESVRRLGDTCIGFTSKGVVQCSDAGWRLLSEEIEPTVNALVTAATADQIANLCFAVADDPRQLYELWYPTTSASAVGCLRALVWCGKTGRWTERTDQKGKTCGAFDRVARRSWYGDRDDGATGDSYTYRERLDGASRYVDDYRHQGGWQTANVVCDVRWQPFLGDDPTSSKRWEEVRAFFEASAPPTAQLSQRLTEAGTAQTDSVTVQGGMARTWGAAFLEGTHNQLIAGVAFQDDDTGATLSALILVFTEFTAAEGV